MFFNHKRDNVGRQVVSFCPVNGMLIIWCFVFAPKLWLSTIMSVFALFGLVEGSCVCSISNFKKIHKCFSYPPLCWQPDLSLAAAQIWIKFGNCHLLLSWIRYYCGFPFSQPPTSILAHWKLGQNGPNRNSKFEFPDFDFLRIYLSCYIFSSTLLVQCYFPTFSFDKRK